jgi:flagellar hook-associated protein 3 FlgL
MRISTTQLYDMGSARISEMQGGMVKTQQQISSGRRILTPSDDPVGAARVLELSQGQSVNEQFAVNRQQAKNLLSQEEGALTTLTSLIQDIQELVVKAGNPSLGNEQRGYLAVELQGRFDDMLGIANSRDGTGNYIFGGYDVSNQPFVTNSGGISYNGDQGQRMLQVGSNRQIALSDSGADVFQRLRTGNGTFATGADPGNTGSGVISQGVVIDSAALTRHRYEIEFSVAGGVTSYVVTDTSAAPPVAYPAQTFTDGQSITFDGLQFSIKGQPAAGDVFTIEPSHNESVFATVQGLIDTLSRPAQNLAERAHLQNGLNKASLEMASMLDNVLSVRASVGARLQEVENLDNAGLDRDLYYSRAISDLQDLDYVKALSDLSRQQVTLEAAQKTFVTVSGLSLFQML